MISRVRIICFLTALTSCTKQPTAYLVLQGATMGTYYHIQYDSRASYQREIDSLLHSFIGAASTYDSTSEISEFNRSGKVVFKSPHLFRMLSVARQLQAETDGLFEPTVMPLIRAHGFSSPPRESLTRPQIDSLRSLVSFDFIRFDTAQMMTDRQGVQVDLSAIGEGYAIDMIADFLWNKGVTDFKVEIGGEMKCKGRNPHGESWRVGIGNPLDRSQLIKTIQLGDEAVSTSGVSQKFFVDENGVRHPHIIDPRTGQSIQNNLLSVTVIDPSAIRADGLATAIMVMGDSAMAFARTRGIKAFIVYKEDDRAGLWSSVDAR